MQAVDNTTVIKPFVDDVNCIGSIFNLALSLIDSLVVFIWLAEGVIPRNRGIASILKPVFHEAEMIWYRQWAYNLERTGVEVPENLTLDHVDIKWSFE